MRVYSPMNLQAMLSSRNIAQELQKVQTYLRQLDGALRQIDGIQQNPVAEPLPPTIDPNPFGDFFYLPGRQGGQLAHGDTNASGKLTLSSTKNATKGKIYLGSSLLSAFDESTHRLGIKIASPTASLHVVGETPASIFYMPVASSGVGFAPSGAPTGHEALDEASPGDNDTTYIANVGATSNSTYGGGLAAITDTGSNTGWVLHLTARKTVALPRTMPWSLTNGSGTVVKTGTMTLTTSYVDIAISLSAGEAAILRANLSGCTLTLGASLGWSSGYAFDDIRVTWMAIETTSTVGGGGKVAIFKIGSGQVVNNTEWQNASGTALLSASAAGKFIIESGGSMQFIPGAGTNKVPVSDSSGNLTLTTLTLFGSIFDTTGTAVAGDIIYRNGSSQWARLGIGSAGQVLTVTAGFPAWATPTPPTNALLDGSNHTDTVAQTVSRGSLIYGNSTPKWDELTIGAASTVLKSDGTDASWGTINNAHIDNRTRHVFFDPSMFASPNGTPTLTFQRTGVASLNRKRAWIFTGAAGDSSIACNFMVPRDYASGDIEFFLHWAAVGTIGDTGGFYVDASGSFGATSTDWVAAASTAIATDLLLNTYSPIDYTYYRTSLGTLSGASAGIIGMFNVTRDVTTEVFNNGSATQQTLAVLGVEMVYTADM